MKTVGIFCTFVLLALFPDLVEAQGMPQGSGLEGQTLRGHTHVFIAYAIAWLLVLGWVVSIARRLGRVENALND